MSKLVANQISPRSGSDLTLNGNVTIGGTITYEDVTNVNSVGIITAQSGVSIADSIFHTGDTNTAIRFPAADTFTGETGGSGAIRVDSSQRLLLGTDTAPSVGGQQFRSVLSGNSFATSGQAQVRYQNDTAGATLILSHARGTEASPTILNNGDEVGKIRFYAHDGNDFASVAAQISVTIDGAPAENDTPGSITFSTTADGASTATERLRVTSTGGVHFSNAELIERVNIVANKLSAVPNVSLDNGMVHYYTTNETTTANPNIISSAGINTNMATGDTMSVTILSKPNGAGYFPRISIDGRLAGITTYWNGGSAPSSAESSGVDVNVYQIIKTGSETSDVLANTSNFA